MLDDSGMVVDAVVALWEYRARSMAKRAWRKASEGWGWRAIPGSAKGIEHAFRLGITR